MLAGWDAAPAGGARNPAPGRPRAAVRPTTRGRLHWRDAARTKGESLPDRGPGSGPVRARKLRPRGQKTPANKPGLRKLVRVERREAPAPSRKEGAARRIPAAPNGAPPPRFFEGHDEGPAQRGGKTAYPAPVKNTGAGAWLFENCICEGRARGGLTSPLPMGEEKKIRPAVAGT